MKTILVVEDEFAMRWVLEAFLGEEGYAVEVASNGQEALERIGARRPDLIVTDVMMPRLTGPELLERLAADPALRSIPVIVMSSMSRAAVEAKGAALEGRPFLRKPFGLDALLRAVAGLIGGP